MRVVVGASRANNSIVRAGGVGFDFSLMITLLNDSYRKGIIYTLTSLLLLRVTGVEEGTEYNKPSFKDVKFSKDYTPYTPQYTLSHRLLGSPICLAFGT